MQIHAGNFNGTTCGSDKGIKIRLQNTPKYQLCTTELSDEFSAGESVTWTGWKLGSCEKIEIDIKAPSIALWIIQEENDKFCPISVTVTLKDTSFHLGLHYTIRNTIYNAQYGSHNITTNVAEYIATNVTEYIAFNTAGSGKFVYNIHSLTFY